jgi:hypothetical protein
MSQLPSASYLKLYQDEEITKLLIIVQNLQVLLINLSEGFQVVDLGNLAELLDQ